jgi:hypothetical protein
MVKYLLEKSTSTKVSTGVYQWTFGTRNEHRPEALRIGPVTVSADSDVKHVVLLSNTFRNDSKSHTLKGNDLQPVLYVVHPEHRVTRNVTATGETASTAPGTDGSVAAISGLKLFMDMSSSTLLTSAYASTPAIGDLARYVYQNAAADQTMIFSGYQDFEVSAFGSNSGRGISSQASWQYAIDSSQPNAFAGTDFTICWTQKHTHQVNGLDTLFKFGFIFDMHIYNSELKIKDHLGNGNGTGLVLIPNQFYMFSVRRMDANGDGNHTFECEMERLDTGATSTGSVSAGTDPTQNASWYISTASEHFLQKSGVLGPVICFDGVAAESITTAKAWLRNHYSGSVDPGGSAATADTSSVVYQLYDSRVEKHELYTPHRTVRDVTIEFRDQANALFDPVDMAINIVV